MKHFKKLGLVGLWGHKERQGIGKGQLPELQRISKGRGDGGNSGLGVTGSWENPLPTISRGQ